VGGRTTKQELMRTILHSLRTKLYLFKEMMNAALDPSTKTVIYKNFAHFLTVDEDILSTT
jgi:hypothetical protein